MELYAGEKEMLDDRSAGRLDGWINEWMNEQTYKLGGHDANSLWIRAV